MGVLDQLLAGLAGGIHTYGQQQDRQAKEARLAADRALKLALLKHTLAKDEDEAQNRQEQRYLQGFRPGQAPDAKGILSGLQIGSAVADASGAPGVSVASQLGNAQAHAAEPEQYAPDRFQQVNANTYIDKTQTPEAVQDRRAMLAAKLAAAKPRPQEHVVDPVTGEVKFFDPTHPPAGLRVHPQPRPDAFTPVVVDGGDGAPPVIKPFNTHTGQAGPAIGNAKPPVTRIESATNTAAKARLEAAISEMNNAHAGMEEFERKLRAGEANIHGIEQIAGRLASAFTHDDPVSMSLQSAALASLNAANPELARYIRRGLSFAEGESMISQRPSDFRTKMSAFLSQAASGASPEMISDIESRRKAILDPLNRNVAPAGAPAGHVPPSGAPQSRAQQLWDAAVAKHGEAKVIAEVGPRPKA